VTTDNPGPADPDQTMRPYQDDLQFSHDPRHRPPLRPGHPRRDLPRHVRLPHRRPSRVVGWDVPGATRLGGQTRLRQDPQGIQVATRSPHPVRPRGLTHQKAPTCPNATGRSCAAAVTPRQWSPRPRDPALRLPRAGHRPALHRARPDYLEQAHRPAPDPPSRPTPTRPRLPSHHRAPHRPSLTISPSITPGYFLGRVRHIGSQDSRRAGPPAVTAKQ